MDVLAPYTEATVERVRKQAYYIWNIQSPAYCGNNNSSVIPKMKKAWDMRF